MSTTESRRDARVSYLCEVACDGGGASRFNSRINDISTSGAFIDAMIHFPNGTEVGLKFSVGETSIEARAEVCHSSPGVGFGVRFIDLSAEHRAAIESLIVNRAIDVLEMQGAHGRT